MNCNNFIGNGWLTCESLVYSVPNVLYNLVALRKQINIYTVTQSIHRCIRVEWRSEGVIKSYNRFHNDHQLVPQYNLMIRVKTESKRKRRMEKGVIIDTFAAFDWIAEYLNDPYIKLNWPYTMHSYRHIYNILQM